ncbi:MucBP domain-containing protein, partial [Enterococcus gilvus]|uniref:MucBP domain-containing protein n=1 Tax=Enterococcus gilvus TaxID=160453 RepID=UPI003D6C250A
GTFTNQEQIVTYVYTKNTVPPVKTGNVITNFVDEEGKNLKSSTQSGNVGDRYTTKPIDIAGYTLDKTKLPVNASGTYTEEEITVVYVYKKNKPVGTKSPNNTNVVNNANRLNSSNNLTVGKGSLKKNLPQTGEKQNYLLIIFGFIILATLAIIHWYKKANNQKEG